MRTLLFWLVIAGAIIAATHTLYAVLWTALGLMVALYFAGIWARADIDLKEVRARLTATAKRADEQNEQFIDGNPTGTFGEFPPAC